MPEIALPTKAVQDQIKSGVDTLLAGRIVKSVQRGITTGVGETTITVQISTVDPSKCSVDVKGTISAGSSVPIIPLELNPNTLIIYSTATQGIAANTKISWEVIEFY